MKRYILMMLGLCWVACFVGLSAIGIAAELPAYKADQLALPSEYQRVSSLAATPNGKLLLAAQKETGEWSLLTYANINQVPTVTPLSIDGDIAWIDCASDGAVLAALEGQSGPMFCWLNEDGTAHTPFQIDNIVVQAKALSERRLLILDGAKLLSLYDAGGNKIGGLDVLISRSFAAWHDTAYIVRDDEIAVYSLSTGAKVHSIAFETAQKTAVSTFTDGQFYVLDPSHVYHVTLDGALPIMSVLDSALGNENDHIASFAMMDDGTLVACVLREMGFSPPVFGEAVDTEIQIIILKPDQSKVRSGETFTITSIYTSERLRLAAHLFQQAHPEIRVQLITRLERGSDALIDDHIRAMNTALFAGDAGDVVVLDGLPVAQYMRRGLLADINEHVAAFGLLPGMVEGSIAADGKTYAIPAEFGVDLLWGRREAIQRIQTIEDISAIASNTGVPPLMARTPEDWIKLFYPVNAPHFQNGDTLRFDTKEFVSFLVSLKALYDTQGEMQILADARPGFHHARKVTQQERSELYWGKVLFGAHVYDSPMQAVLNYTVSGAADSAYRGLPTVLSGEHLCYKPFLLTGVNARTRHPELAVAFLKTLLSAEVQDAPELFSSLYNPTRAASLRGFYDIAIKRLSEEVVTLHAGYDDQEILVKAPDTMWFDALYDYCAALNQPVFADETIIRLIVEESAAFFEGRIDAETAARSVELRAWAYLNE